MVCAAVDSKLCPRYTRAMVYVALLRGVNVGGANKVDMKELKNVFEAAGMTSAKTYINSGNVVFATDNLDHVQIAKLLESSIEERSI